MTNASTSSAGPPRSAESPRDGLRAALGWVCLALAFGYTLVLYSGLGHAAGDNPTQWWHPTNFLIDTITVGTWQDDSNRAGILYLTLPSALLTLGVFLGTRSGLARALAASCTATCATFAFYGLLAPGIWTFFHWRWTLVIVGTGLALGFTLTAPLLAASLLRLKPWLALLLYLPCAFAVVALIRGATGTDENLFFNFSPWPAIPVLGLEVASYVVVGYLAALALALALAASGMKRPVLFALGALAALVVPIVWFLARFAPPQAPAGDEAAAGSGGTLLVALAISGALAFGLALITRERDRPQALLRRAGHIALGGLLVWLPLFAGRAMADGDYAANKFARAQVLIDALSLHYENEDSYPDELSELVDGGYLEALPRPRVGFEIVHALGLTEQTEFSYRSLGSSYVLEFVSTEWVQCAYNPPWLDEDDEEEEFDDEDEEYADEENEEAWSCPDARPELW